MITHKKFGCTSCDTSHKILPCKLWKAEVENWIGRKIKCLRLDNSTKYMDSRFLELCEEHGIKRHFIVLKTPQ